MSFKVKNSRLAQIQDLKGTPFEIFSGTSRPMRSQYSELSTNQRPRFQPYSWCWPNLESTNPLTICQSITNSPILDQSANPGPILCQSANPLRIRQSIANPPIYYQSANLMPIDIQFNFRFYGGHCI